MEYDRPYLSKAEREWVYKAHGIDNHENYELHHITPVYYAIALLGMAEEEINAPENLIPLPKYEHRSIHKPPHEMRGWQERQEPYWNTDRDDELRSIAQERTNAFEKQGNIFPGRRGV